MEIQRSIRRLKADPVDDALVLRLIELALKAPTGSNGQSWEFVVVRDREVKERLGRLNRQAFRIYGAIGRMGDATAPRDASAPRRPSSGRPSTSPRFPSSWWRVCAAFGFPLRRSPRWLLRLDLPLGPEPPAGRACRRPGGGAHNPSAMEHLGAPDAHLASLATSSRELGYMEGKTSLDGTHRSTGRKCARRRPRANANLSGRCTRRPHRRSAC
ncbi:MAG: nitroreductase family protein [Actinomycetota bacterium]|nr:nitroreductase family protein [Actinomycetota bacterium]